MKAKNLSMQLELVFNLTYPVDTRPYLNVHGTFITAQKMKFSIKDFFCKCDQIHSFLRIWLHLLKKS